MIPCCNLQCEITQPTQPILQLFLHIRTMQSRYKDAVVKIVILLRRPSPSLLHLPTTTSAGSSNACSGQRLPPATRPTTPAT